MDPEGLAINAALLAELGPRVEFETGIERPPDGIAKRFRRVVAGHPGHS
jgi:hypothetical protein